MLKPIAKVKRTYDDGTGKFYFCGTNEPAQYPTYIAEFFDKQDEIIDRLNSFSEAINILSQEVNKHDAKDKT